MGTAFISGANGQDGSYLTEFLLKKDYKVIALCRHKATGMGLSNLSGVLDHPNLTIVEGDITDPSCVSNTILGSEPSEIYHLAANSLVSHSWDNPYNTFDINVMGTINVLEAAKSLHKNKKSVRVYNAGSSEMFGLVQDNPQTEKTKFWPRSLYGCSKVSAFELCRNYRESFGMFIANGILFNHTSVRRGKDFFERKVSDYIGRLVNGLTEDKLKLGNLRSSRDIGHSPEYVEGMWLMLQHEEPDDFVLATGESKRMSTIVRVAFDAVGLNWEDYVIHNTPENLRPAEVDYLRGSAEKAYRRLGWMPRTYMKELIEMLVKHDVESYKK